MTGQAGIVPVDQSLLSPAALLATVAADYAIETPRQCLLWSNNVTQTYIVTAEHARYILRVYKTGRRTDDDVAYELEALRHLDGKGLAVSVPIVRRDGAWFQTIQAPEGPRQMALFTSAPGGEAYRDEGYAARYGRSVAALHAASDDFLGAHQRFHLDITVLLERPLARIAPLLAYRPADWQYLQDLAAEVRRQVTALAAAGLEWGFCHGDTLGSNAYRDGDVITHFDSDDCGPGWRAYDLATFVWIWAWHEKPERGQEFLEGYSAHRPIAAVDRRALPLFVVLREIWVTGQQTREAATLGHALITDAYFDARLRFLRSWEQQLGTI